MFDGRDELGVACGCVDATFIIRTQCASYSLNTFVCTSVKARDREKETLWRIGGGAMFKATSCATGSAVAVAIQ